MAWNKWGPSLRSATAVARNKHGVRAGIKEGVITVHWVPSRSMGAVYWRDRFRLAWGVFTGQYDALKWDGQ